MIGTFLNVDSAAFAAAAAARLEALRPAGKRRLKVRADRIRDRAEQLCRQQLEEESGELARSWKVVETDDGWKAGSTAPHAVPVEYGTSVAEARPMLRPAVAEERRRR